MTKKQTILLGLLCPLLAFANAEIRVNGVVVGTAESPTYPIVYVNGVLKVLQVTPSPNVTNDLNITAMIVTNDIATFMVATTDIVGTPFVEVSTNEVLQWFTAVGQVATNMVTNWIITCAVPAAQTYWRARSDTGAP